MTNSPAEIADDGRLSVQHVEPYVQGNVAAIVGAWENDPADLPEWARARLRDTVITDDDLLRIRQAIDLLEQRRPPGRAQQQPLPSTPAVRCDPKRETPGLGREWRKWRHCILFASRASV